MGNTSTVVKLMYLVAFLHYIIMIMIIILAGMIIHFIHKVAPVI